MNRLKYSESFNDIEQEEWYWTNGKSVFYRKIELKSADLETFEYFHKIWAKDKKSCYSGSTKLKSANPAFFSALNLTYAKDKENVWVLAGKIENADAKTFEICDNGQKSNGKSLKLINDEKKLYESFVPYGFGKDKSRVYYYDFHGKGKIVKNANPKNFKSFNDSFFGYDNKYVFCGIATIPKANPNSWKKLKEDYYYSKDGNSIFYFNRLIKGADADTFEIVLFPIITGQTKQYAKDKNTAYRNDKKISFEKLMEEIEQETIYYNKVVRILK